MKYDALQIAVKRLNKVVDNPGGIGEPSEANHSAESDIIRAVYERSRRLLDMGKAALAGRPPKIITRIVPDKEMRDLIESVGTFYIEKGLLEMQSAAQDVFELLTQLVKRADSS